MMGKQEKVFSSVNDAYVRWDVKEDSPKVTPRVSVLARHRQLK